MWVLKICWRKDRLPTPVFLGSLVAKLVKNPAAMWETWVQSPEIPWRREGLPTPVLWPGEFHGLYSTWGRKELDTTERLSLSLSSNSLVSNSAFTTCWGLFGLTSISSLHTRCGPATSFYFAVCAFTLLPLIFLLFFFFFSLSLSFSSSSPFFPLISSSL